LRVPKFPGKPHALAGNQRHQPENISLYAIVEQHLPTPRNELDDHETLERGETSRHRGLGYGEILSQLAGRHRPGLQFPEDRAPDGMRQCLV